jgi:molybdopterin molybdotransferase
VTRKLLDDCFLTDSERMRHDEALALITTRLSRVAEVESVPLRDADGRVLAADAFAPRPVPAFTNAAVDGYAFAHASLGSGSPLRVTARVQAGQQSGAIRPGEAARIFTGAPMPEGADTCVMQEDTETANGGVTIPPGLKRGANTRKAGEDFSAGAIVAAAGARLRPQDVAAIAATGTAVVECCRRLRVAVLSTGDELLEPGATWRPGGVYDSNRAMIAALLRRANVEVIDGGVVPDRADAVEAAVREAARTADVILSTGGASRGEADHIVATIARLGRLTAWQIAVKPGRPLAMGQIGDTVFFALPGNPVAAFVTFLLYARPMLAILGGEDWRPPRRFPVAAAFVIPSRKTGRREFWRATLVDTPRGLAVEKFARDGSGLISGLSSSGGLIDVAEDTISIAEGDPVGFIPYGEFGL